MSTAIYPSLRDRRVVITGGGSGIGATIVTAFARQGAQVAFIDIAESASQALVDSLSDALHPPVFHSCNLTDLHALASTFAEIEAATGAVEVLVNNAANDDRHSVESVSPAYWEERIGVNLRHQFFCAQAVAPGMKAMKRGVILNFGSISWHLALPDLVLYMTSKAGIEGMTRGLARDLGADGIRVNCIVPGSVLTERQIALWHDPAAQQSILESQCLREAVEPEDVAALTLFLASDDARRCSGREYYIDAGWYGS